MIVYEESESARDNFVNLSTNSTWNQDTYLETWKDPY